MARRRIEQAKLATGRIRDDPAMQLVICVTRVRRCIGHSVVYFLSKPSLAQTAFQPSPEASVSNIGKNPNHCGPEGTHISVFRTDTTGATSQNR